MSIFKETFKSEIRNQIKARQEALVERSPNSIQYYNSRNAWIRMTSSVNVGNDNGALANNYILLGGILYDKQNPLKSGIGSTSKEAYSTVTPSGAEHRLGIRPMPGITSIDIKSKSAYGSLREVTVNFQCWDIRQLEDLELLYMRPGYSVLVEWGWLPYLDNNKFLHSRAGFMNAVLKGGNSKESIWKGIHKAALDTNGNYDGHYGFIKNYSWSARPDGGYDCTTSIISMGEILESLKVNYSPTDTEKSMTGLFGFLGKSYFGKDKPITNAYNENIIAGICAELHQIGIVKNRSPFDVGKYLLCKAKIEVKGKPEENSNKGIQNNEEQVYIALKDFIDILNTKVLIKDSTSKKPLCELSLNYGEHNGGTDKPLLCLGDIHQISIDPTVCLINTPVWLTPSNLGLEGIAGEDDFKAIATIINSMPPSYPYWEGDWKTNQRAIIGNIFVNVAYIYSLVTNSSVEAQDKKEKNDIALYDLLKNIMLGVNTAIGNVANFEVFLDSTDNITRIIDVSYTGDRDSDWEKISEVPIELQNTKSIVRSYKLESQIFPEQSSIVAIGAQAQGGALASNTNTLVDYNQNLIDRIIPKKDVDDLTNAAPPTQEEINQKVQSAKDNLGTLVSYIANLKPSVLFGWFGGDGFDVNDSGKFANALKDTISYHKSYVIVDSGNRNLIPTKLSLTTDGIGGIIIGNLFKVPDDVLPRGYKKGAGGGPEKIGYAVTGLNHSVQNNDWTTTIDAQFIILDEPSGIGKITSDEFDRIKARNRDTGNYDTGSGQGQGNSNTDYKINPPLGNLVTAAKASIGFSTVPFPLSEGGNVGCACAVSIMFLRATGYQIVPGKDITYGTGELYYHLKGDTKNWRARSLSKAQPGDVIVTARGTVAGHTGIVIDTINKDGTFDIISNSSSGFRGSAPGTIQQNYSIKKWNSITVKNPKQTLAFEYIGPYKTA